ncbi:hypothetical protein GGR51DRAFT_509185 [Nemania sp. FL0031]|nr:hypothetical protein GGR51DRAFT_509185 [Nemania sp. FL0031]
MAPVQDRVINWEYRWRLQSLPTCIALLALPSSTYLSFLPPLYLLVDHHINRHSLTGYQESFACIYIRLRYPFRIFLEITPIPT